MATSRVCLKCWPQRRAVGVPNPWEDPCGPTGTIQQRVSDAREPLSLRWAHTFALRCVSARLHCGSLSRPIASGAAAGGGRWSAVAGRHRRSSPSKRRRVGMSPSMTGCEAVGAWQAWLRPSPRRWVDEHCLSPRSVYAYANVYMFWSWRTRLPT